MTWVTWRQHRQEALWALVFTALLAGCVGYVAWQLSVASGNCPRMLGSGYCLSGDPLGQLTLGEGTIINGSGVQRTTNSRWGDYSSMNVDPTDDCTFWYVNEYYTAAGQASSTAGWQTRVASFKLPGCH